MEMMDEAIQCLVLNGSFSLSFGATKTFRDFLVRRRISPYVRRRKRKGLIEVQDVDVDVKMLMRWLRIYNVIML